MKWNFDMSEAPSGYFKEKTTINKTGVEKTTNIFVTEKCIVATECGEVGISKKLESGRWNGCTINSPPIAWIAFPVHPNKDIKYDTSKKD